MQQQAKPEDHTGKFVCDCCPSPEPPFVLSRNWQLDDFMRFCTVPGSISILTVDPIEILVYAHCVSPSALEDRGYSSWKSDGVTLEARDSQINRGSILQLVYSAQI